MSEIGLAAALLANAPPRAALASRKGEAILRAQAQRTLIARLGVRLPVEIVHDMGTLLAERDAVRRPPSDATMRKWARFVSELRSLAPIAHLHRHRLGPPLIAALIVHALRPLIELRLSGFDALVDALPRCADRIRVRVARLDLDTLRLLAMAEGEALEAPDAAHVSAWLRLFDDPAIHDIVNFTLDVLPSVLAATHRPKAQTYAINGYAGLAREGVIDDMLLTELAWDDDLFTQRWLEGELFYHARERARDQEPEHHLVLVDATAAMRGLREAFARGTAMALVQHLVRGRRTVEVAFFDSIVHPRVKVTAREHATTHLLGFQERRGRDAARAFTQLEQMLVELRETTPNRLMVTIITHAGCLVPLATMEAIVALAQVTGVFVLPSGPLPEYGALLHHTHVIRDDELSHVAGRQGATARVLGL